MDLDIWLCSLWVPVGVFLGTGKMAIQSQGCTLWPTQPILLHRHLRWLGHLTRTHFMGASKVRCPKTYPSRWSPWGRSKTCWIDYSSWLIWECLSVLLNELKETSGQNGWMLGWMLGWMMFSEICQWPGKEPGLVPYLKPELPSNIPLFNVWYLLTYWKVQIITQKWQILKYTVFWVYFIMREVSSF